MNIRGIVVCVDCSDLLCKSLSRWKNGLERLIVITSTRDTKTQSLCQSLNVDTHVTDVFYANGAFFNKGAAMSEAVFAKGLRAGADWLMTFDADIVPPEDWADQIRKKPISCGKIYGAYRHMAPENTEDYSIDGKPKMPQGWVIGFFMMFHASDHYLPPQDYPLFDTHWPHAGNYDTIFCRRWPKDRQIILTAPRMIHLGEERKNWTGRFNRGKLDALLNRRRAHEDWNREKMKDPPALFANGQQVWPKVVQKVDTFKGLSHSGAK